MSRPVTRFGLLLFLSGFPLLGQVEAPIHVAVSPETGLASFLATPPGLPLPVAAPASAGAEQRARAFLDAQGAAFGVRSQTQVRARRIHEHDAVGMDHVRFEQVHEGVPVTGGGITIHLRGAGVVAVNAEILPGLEGFDTRPSIHPPEAAAITRELLARHLGISEARLGAPRLEILNRGLLEGSRRPTRLAWFVEASGAALREFVWIDAKTGALLLHFSQLADALDRKVYNGASASALPGTLVRIEGGPSTGDTDADLAYTYAGDTWSYFWTTHGRDSFDGAGATIVSTVHHCPTGGPCPYANAFWNGSQMVYGDGFPAADDVVAHEIAHAVTERAADLFYYMQSGALNESFSDIFGEAVDLTNAGGNDASSVRWQMGEDVPGSGAVRNLLDPTLFGDPGKTSDAQLWCSAADNGGVHTNSGVPNHAFALMVDGGSYNGVTVTGIGLSKAGKIEYRALTEYLLSGSGMRDADAALRQSCTDLTGTAGITAADCAEVGKALDAVQMVAPWPCPTGQTQPQEPALCPAGQVAVSLFFDDLEAGAGNWLTSTPTGPDLWLLGDFFAQSGTQHLWGENKAATADSRTYLNLDVAIPAGGARLQFDHAFDFESSGSTYFDGGVIEVSTDGGTAWSDAGGLITAGKTYGGTIFSGDTNPLKGRSAFVASSYGYTASQLDLSSFAGQSVRVRFRLGTDSIVNDLGWMIDDVRIYRCSSLGSAGAVTLAKTGQAASFKGGDDGNLQAGAAWPSPRFLDQGDGTVTDALTGLVWLADAGCLGTHAWTDALAAVAALNAIPSGPGCAGYAASHTDWRLPNVLELESLSHLGQADQAAWLGAEGLANTLGESYWSATSQAADTSRAWAVDLSGGALLPLAKDETHRVWAVRGGTTGAPDPAYPANVWKTGQTASSTAGDDGALQRGVAWPVPRWSDNGDGTITDSLTGLTWLRDAACLGGDNWYLVPARIATLNQTPASLSCAGYTAAHTDWRLPNRRELLSLIDFSATSTSGPAAAPFTNGGSLPTFRFWTSSVHPDGFFSGVWYAGADLSGDPGSGLEIAFGSPNRVTAVRGGSVCSYGLAPASATSGYAGGSASLALTASAPSCGWALEQKVSWIFPATSTSGNGSTTVGYRVQANTTTTPRTGSLVVAGKTFTVSQDGAPCAFSFLPAAQPFGAAGGATNVQVQVPATDCAWTALSNDAWITITSGTSGTGTGLVRYTVDANPGSSARAGSLTLAGQTFSVTQAANGIAADVWTPKEPLSALRSNLGAAEIGGLVYAVGGGSGSGDATLAAYDPATNTWTARASMSTGRSSLGVAAVGGKLYALSGWDGNGMLVNTPTVEAYDPATDTWSPRASMLTGRRAFAAAVANGKIYAFGGCDPACNAISAVEEYDPATDAWTARAPLPTPRRGAAAATVNGKIYVIGGCPASCSSLSTVEEYDPATNAWASRAPMPTPRSFLSAVALGGRIYALGGFTGTNGTSLATVEVYDPATNTWSSAVPLLTPRRSFGAAAAGNRIYTIGGLTGSSLTQIASVEQYTPYPALEIGNATVSEGHSGSAPATFTVTLSEASSATVTVQADTANGTATAGEDYDAGSTPLTFPPGTTAQGVAVTVHGDTGFEPDETFAVQLSGPSQALLGPMRTGIGTILNDDIACTFTLTPTSQAFGAAGGPTNVTVQASAAGCAWTALSNDAWITVTSGTSGTGTGLVRYTVDANPGSSARAGSLTLAGQTFTVTQAANGIAADVWTPKEPLSALRSSLGAAEIGGLVYAVGGGTGSGDATATAYDPATNTWTARASMSTGRSGLGLAAVGGKLYALSGWDGNGMLVNTPTVEAYDPATDTWSPRASMLTGRRAFAAAVANGKIYAFGGCDAACNALSAVEEYDPATDAWTARAPLPTPRLGAAAATVNGKIYVMGGCASDCGSLGTVEEYNPLTDTWASRAAMPTPRLFLSAVALGGRIYALGGFTGTNGTSLATVEVYDPATNTWSSAAPLLTPRRLFGAAVAGNRIYAIGGLTGSGLTQLASVEQYTPYPTLEIGNATVSEGHSDSAPAAFTVTLSEASSATVTVQADTANGTATAGEDYQAASATVTFPPGSTGQSFPVAVLGDTGVEPDETFAVQLSGPSQALLGPTRTGIGTILNDDAVLPPLLVLSTSPALNAADITPAAELSATFDQLLDPDTVTAGTFRVRGLRSGLATTDSLSFDEATKTLHFPPDQGFEAGEPVTATLTSGLQSSLGAPLEDGFTWSFYVAAAGGTGTFAASDSEEVGIRPSCFVVDDFDADGNPDLAVKNMFSNSFSIFLGAGDGTLTPGTEAAPGGYTEACAGDDFDNDGHLDLVASGTEGIWLLLGNGDGTFTTGGGFSTPSDIHQAMTAGDFDGDGNPDVAVTNRNNHSVSVALGNGDGTFGSVAVHAVAGASYGITAGDFDGDGRLDLAAVDNPGARLSILRNDGGGAFTALPEVAVGGSPYSVHTADFNGDGHLDLVVDRGGVEDVALFPGLGTGSFGPPSSLPFRVNGDTGYLMAVGDLNADGHLDLAGVHVNDNLVSIAPGDGAGSFGPVGEIALDAPDTIAFGDFDKDGALDLVVANDRDRVPDPNPSPSTVTLLLNLTCAEALALSPETQSFGAAGGSGSFAVTAPGICTWSATSDAAWLTVTSGGSGSGDGTVGYSVAANASSLQRTGTITVAGHTFTVTQEGVPCTWSVQPDSLSLPAEGGAGDIVVSAPAGCAWTAASNDPWIGITGTGGSGNGVVSYSVGANAGVFPRAGTLTVAGQTVPVAQAAAGLDFFTVTPCRLVDTRTGSPLVSNAARTFQVTGLCGVPTDAKAVSLNATVVSPTGIGLVILYPGGMAMPGTSTLHFSTGQTRANNAVLALAPDGSGTLGGVASIGSAGQVHLVIDVNGYFE